MNSTEAVRRDRYRGSLGRQSAPQRGWLGTVQCLALGKSGVGRDALTGHRARHNGSGLRFQGDRLQELRCAPRVQHEEADLIGAGEGDGFDVAERTPVVSDSLAACQHMPMHVE